MQSAVEYAGTISPRFQMYLDTAQWLKDHTAEDSTVGYLEVGIIAYYSERQILDLLGLVTPGIESFIAEGDFASLFQHLRPDYYLRNRDIEHWKMNSRVTASPFFQRNYQPVALIPQRGKHPMIIYQRRSPLVPNPTQPLSLLERIAQAPGTHASYGLETDIPGYTSIALPDAIQQAIQGQDVWLVTQPTHVADIVHAVQKANQTDDPSLHILWFNHPDVPQTIFWLTTKPPSERFVILEMYDLLTWADPEQLARWWSAYGRELQENQDFANAAFAYQQALEFNPHDAQLHMSLAVALMGAGRYQKALAEMEQAVQLAPTDAKAYRLLGKTYLSLGQYEKATDAFQHAYALDASEPDLLFLLAWAQWRAGDPQAALQWLDQLDQYDHLPPDLRQRSEQLRKNIAP